MVRMVCLTGLSELRDQSKSASAKYLDAGRTGPCWSTFKRQAGWQLFESQHSLGLKTKRAGKTQASLSREISCRDRVEKGGGR